MEKKFLKEIELEKRRFAAKTLKRGSISAGRFDLKMSDSYGSFLNGELNNIAGSSQSKMKLITPNPLFSFKQREKAQPAWKVSFR